MMDSQENFFGYGEAPIKGVSSITPELNAIQHLILAYVEQLAYYIIQLEQRGYSNAKIQAEFLDVLASMIENVDYTEKTLNEILTILYDEIYEARELYSKICEKNGDEPFFLKSPCRFKKECTLSEAIKQGQKIVKKNLEKVTEEEKQKIQIFEIVLKSICLYVIELIDLKENVDFEYKKLLSALSILNFSESILQRYDELMEDYVNVDHELALKVYDVRKREFGEFQKVKIPTEIKPGKCILVAGTNLKELELILEATKDKSINVYTHGQMIVAHTYKKFEQYKHLAGHFGRGIEYCGSDFANFHGPIYLTKLSLHKMDRVFRRPVFTSDRFVPEGLITVQNHNYEELIERALNSRGYNNPREGRLIEHGLSEREFYSSMSDISRKIEDGEFKHIMLLGVSNGTEEQADFFRNFFSNLSSDSVVVSFSYFDPSISYNRLNMDYAFPFVYKILEEFLKVRTVEELDPVILFTRCEPHTIPNLFYMKYLGIKRIYFGECSPILVNPKLVNIIRDELGLLKYSTPQNDAEVITGKKP